MLLQLFKNLVKEEKEDIDLKTPASGKAKYKNLTCNYCHKKGHFKADCLKLKNIVVGFDSAESGVLEISIGAHIFAKAMRLRRSNIYIYIAGPFDYSSCSRDF